MNIPQWHKDHPYGARTPEYMDEVLANIKRIWLQFPQERLGQLIVNCSSGVDFDPFHVFDEQWSDIASDMED